MATNPISGPAPRPCISCPYRRDVPSGVWHPEDYAKLALYDVPTGDQPTALFLCHQNDHDADRTRVCAGWVGCHGVELLALRFAAIDHGPEFAAACWDYRSPVPLFASGAEAASHGMAEVLNPGDRAVEMIRKIVRVRSDLRTATQTGA